MRTFFRPTTLRGQLLLGLGLVLFVAWLTAAIFTKKASFQQSRAFLTAQATKSAELLLSAIDGQALTQKQLSRDEQQIVRVWRDGVLQLGAEENAVSAELNALHGKNLDTVKRIGPDNWVVSARCNGADCAVVAIRDTDRRLAVRMLVVSIFLPLLAIFLCTLSAAYIAVRLVLRPVDALACDVSGLDLDRIERLPERDLPAELSPLASAINDLSIKTRDVLDRERAFFDACSHEIRTPLTGLIAQVHSLNAADQVDLPKGVRAHLTFIERGAQRAARIANQFLTLAKTNNLIADPDAAIAFDLTELVRTQCAEALAANPDLTVTVQGDDQILASGDPLAIELIMQNLIENARQHANADQLSIRVTVQRVLDMVAISVEDNGRGVAVEDLKRLGDRFYRCTDRRGTAGAGLGLSIIKDVAAVYCGRLDVKHSCDLGGLAVSVWLTLPETRDTRPQFDRTPVLRGSPVGDGEHLRSGSLC